MATYVPQGFRVISALSATFSAGSGPTSLYTAPANSFALLNVVASNGVIGSIESLNIGGVAFLTISYSGTNSFFTTGMELFRVGGESNPPNSARAGFLAVVGPGQTLSRSSLNLFVAYVGVLLGT